MTTTEINPQLNELHDAGAHVGFTRSRRHPSARKFIHGTRNRSDMFDLERTAANLDKAKDFIAKVAASGRQVLFVGGKDEVVRLVKEAALKANQPHVAGRWIGGTLTNFGQIRKRIERMNMLRTERDRGEREKYTKKERLLLDREIENLEFRFEGISGMDRLPAALLVVDPRHEKIAIAEANQMGVPVIALANSDCDFALLQYPIPANDGSVKSVTYVLGELVDAYRKSWRPIKAEEPKPAPVRA